MCVDDHRLVREGLCLMIKRQAGFEVVACGANGDEAIQLFREHRPDVTLMDLQMPVKGGLDAIRAIRREDANARIVVLTMYEGDEDIHQALRAGAAAYVLKDVAAADLIQVMLDVHSGKAPTSPGVRTRDPQTAGATELTTREIEVLEVVAEGKRNKEIAVNLGITTDTVEAHLKRIFEKLGVHDRTAAIRVALTRGIIHFPR